jgi:uncharacterized protein YfiM (DUF2279 family)
MAPRFTTNLLRCVTFSMLVLHFHQAFSQRDTMSTQSRNLMRLGVGIIPTATSYVLLNELWYKDFPRSPMHSFNDNSEWLQVDKAGHAFSGYQLSRLYNALYLWSGSDQRRSTLLACSSSMMYLTSIELLDGRSAQWGFSWGDMIANTSGNILFFAQQKWWNEQRIAFKFSYQSSVFAKENPELLGRNFQQRIIKDYNAQTYWTSFNVHRFLASDAAFPRWLNVAIGYGATKMTTAKNVVDDVNNFQREREFYFSFDADLERVRWKKKWMQRTAKVLSFIKIPGPTLEIRESGKMKLHGLFF